MSITPTTHTILVTAFLCNINQRNRSTYIEHGRCLLATKIPKIAFIDDTIIDQFHSDEWTTLVPVSRAAYSYLQEYETEMKKSFELVTDNSAKDTLDYIVLMCNKTEFMREAIQRAQDTQATQARQFVWVDFGIRYLAPHLSDTEFQTTVIDAFSGDCTNAPKGIRIGSIWDLSTPTAATTFNEKQIAWYFAGGVFGGSAVSLLEFADLVREHCLERIRQKRTMTWEVNVWYLIYCKRPELFSTYSCNHDMSLFDNFRVQT